MIVVWNCVQEWGASCPHEFLDAYRLEYDQTWTHVSRVQTRDEENAVINKIISHQLAMADPNNPLGLPAVTQGASDSRTKVTEVDEASAKT